MVIDRKVGLCGADSKYRNTGEIRKKSFNYRTIIEHIMSLSDVNTSDSKLHFLVVLKYLSDVRQSSSWLDR